ncbi:MAG: hypothetical protein DCC73_14995 [Proteobacteria bacterium]|nr:MAG: hypothetical protein DCC73_14995 [Pseudomonadota bacterium]
MIVLKTKRRSWKPNGPQQIDWTHPLTRGLAQCYLLDHAGPPTCLVRPDLYSLAFVDAPAWGPRAGGQGFFFDGSNDAAKLTIASGTAIEGQRFVSMGVVASWGTDAGTDRRMIGFRDESGTNPTWGIGTDDTAVQRVRGWFRTSATGFVELQSTANAFGDNLPHAAIVTTDAEYSAAPANANKLYVDGKLEAEASSNANWQAANMTFDNFSLGALYRAGAASSLFKGTIYLAAVWTGRTFSTDELEAWSREPYQIFRPLARRIWYLPAGGGTVTLGLASDASAALPLARVKARVVGQSSDGGSAMTLTSVKARGLGLAADGNAALAVSRLKARSVAIAADAGSVFTLDRLKARGLGLVEDYSAAFSLGFGVVISLGLASDAGGAFSLGRLKARPLGLADDAGGVFSLGRLKTRSLGAVNDSGAVFSLSLHRRADLGLALDHGASLALGRLKARAIGLASDSSMAFSLTLVWPTSPPASRTHAIIARANRVTIGPRDGSKSISPRPRTVRAH